MVRDVQRNRMGGGGMRTLTAGFLAGTALTSLAVTLLMREIVRRALG